MFYVLDQEIFNAVFSRSLAYSQLKENFGSVQLRLKAHSKSQKTLTGAPLALSLAFAVEAIRQTAGA